MPDAFFVSQKTRKRKRPSKDGGHGPLTKKPQRAVNGKGRPQAAHGQVNGKTKSKRRDEELDSDDTREDELGGIDDLDLRGSDGDAGTSGEEDEMETPAEKRLRLAKVYLDSVKEGLAGKSFVILFSRAYTDL